MPTRIRWHYILRPRGRGPNSRSSTTRVHFDRCRTDRHVDRSVKENANYISAIQVGSICEYLVLRGEYLGFLRTHYFYMNDPTKVLHMRALHSPPYTYERRRLRPTQLMRTSETILLANPYPGDAFPFNLGRTSTSVPLALVTQEELVRTTPSYVCSLGTTCFLGRRVSALAEDSVLKRERFLQILFSMT